MKKRKRGRESFSEMSDRQAGERAALRARQAAARKQLHDDHLARMKAIRAKRKAAKKAARKG